MQEGSASLRGREVGPNSYIGQKWIKGWSFFSEFSSGSKVLLMCSSYSPASCDPSLVISSWDPRVSVYSLQCSVLV